MGKQILLETYHNPSHTNSPFDVLHVVQEDVGHSSDEYEFAIAQLHQL